MHQSWFYQRGISSPLRYVAYLDGDLRRHDTPTVQNNELDGREIHHALPCPAAAKNVISALKPIYG
jgi:hypothetical protein